MPWEYLESDHMDERFRVAVKQLEAFKIDWAKAFVIDINCGTSARLLNALPQPHGYFGNDIDLENIPDSAARHASYAFYKGTDEEIRQFSFGGPEDRLVVCCFGYSSDDHEGWLSSTLEETYRLFIRELKPSHVVLEKSVRWLHPPWQELVSWPEWNDYECVDIDVHEKAAEHLEWRRVRVGMRMSKGK